MGRVVAVHDPCIAGSCLRDPLPKAPNLGLDPARVPVDRIEMHDRKSDTRSDRTRQRRLASPARPEDENALRHGHLPPPGYACYALTCISACCHSTKPRPALAWCC